MISWLNNWIWVQQDYFWFLAGIGWLSVGALWWQHRRSGDMPGWIPWSAGAGVAIAVTQIVMLITPVVHRVPNEPVNLRGDMLLGAIFAVQAVGWWAHNLRAIRGGRVLTGLIGLLALVAAGLRWDSPTAGTVIILSLLSGAFVWAIVTASKGQNIWREAMAIVVLGAVADTTGPIATLLSGAQRWYDFPPFGPWAGLVQCLASATILGQWHFRSVPALDHQEMQRPERRFFVGAVCWLAVGLAFAVLVGTQGLVSFERSALGRVRTAADVMSKANVETLLDGRLQIGKPQWHEFPNGSRLPWAYSEHAAEFAEKVTAELTQIAAVQDDIRFASITTIREGWLVGVAFSGRPGDFGSLSLIRPITADDSRAWDEKRASVVPPVILGTGEDMYSMAPLQDSNEHMLGWLRFSFSPNQWLAAQAQPRALAYLVIALGLVIGRQLVIQRKRTRERDRAQANAETATEASRLKTSFLANVSHELRTPLQSILGYTDLLLSRAIASDRERLLAVRENADLMGRLVNDLIDLSAAESGRFQLIERPVVLADLVVQTAESLRLRAEAKDLVLSVEVSAEVPGWVHADPQRVRQVVFNLLGNAIKYTDLGHVSVVLALVGRDQNSAEVELRVADSGPGIPPDEQPFLFDAFHRLERTKDREGSGLGLAIVAAVTRAMEGTVRVESDGRTGSRFIARWRLRLAPQQDSATAGRVPLHGKRVLVVDDNALIRDLFVSFLTECGAVCATAADGLDAVRRLRVEDFDAVVLDLAMPKLDGLSTVRRIRQERPDRIWRIVGVSAHASGAEHDAALAAGMDAFLVKPVTLPDLARALAPTNTWTPPARSFESMRAHLAQRFRTDAPAQSAAVARALQRGRWPDIRAAAHYLKNSADVVGDSELAHACAALESAARAMDRKAGDEAWRHCRLALARWLSEPHVN